MVLFNFRKILIESGRSGHEFLRIFKYVTYKPKFLYGRNKTYAEKDWSGNSFLINPKLLLRNRKNHKDMHIIEYIGLASLRNYSDYAVRGTTTLDLLACYGKEDIINNNSLLYTENGKLHFKYEEAKKE